MGTASQKSGEKLRDLLVDGSLTLVKNTFVFWSVACFKSNLSQCWTIRRFRVIIKICISFEKSENVASLAMHTSWVHYWQLSLIQGNMLIGFPGAHCLEGGAGQS